MISNCCVVIQRSKANNRRQPVSQTGIRDPNTPENAETVAGGEAISMASKKTKPDLAAGLGVVVFRGPQGAGFYKGGHNDSTGNTWVCVEKKQRCVVILSNRDVVTAIVLRRGSGRGCAGGKLSIMGSVRRCWQRS